MREREERHENSPGFIYLFFFFPFLFLSQVTGHAFCKSKYRRIRLKTVRSDHFRCAGQRHRNDELVAHHPARQKTPDRNRWSRSRILAELLAYIHTTLSLSLFFLSFASPLGTVLQQQQRSSRQAKRGGLMVAPTMLHRSMALPKKY